MQITDHFLAVPPHLSVEWGQIASLFQEEGNLIVSLKSDDKVILTGLTSEEVGKIFEAHSRFLSKIHLKRDPTEAVFISASPLPPFVPGMGGMAAMGGMGGMGGGLAFPFFHNPEQRGAPHLPAEIIEKLAGILKMVLPQLMDGIAPPVAGCSCPFCQVAAHVHLQGVTEEEAVSPEELSFSDWRVIQTGEKLYTVESQSPLDEKEQFTVFLGEPIGCTCGFDRCKHVEAVLKT